MSEPARRADLAHDLVLPTLLFAALGAMTWAVRGCSGFGAVNGCVFAGVVWGGETRIGANWREQRSLAGISEIRVKRSGRVPSGFPGASGRD